MTNFEEFYSAYPNKQAKDRCKGYYSKISDEEHKEIMLALDSHKRWRREAEKAGEFVPTWCNAATWIYQKRYRDELPCSTSELKEKQRREKCATHDCQGDALKTGYCIDCEAMRPDWRKDMLKAHWNELGRPKTREDCLKVIYEKNPVFAKRLGRID